MIFVQKCIENKPLYSVFINLTKAFDTVNREARKSNKSAAFAISNGVKKDCVLAPILFFTCML